MQERRQQYEALQKQLRRSSDTQISTVDGDSRSVPHKTGIIEVSYSTQVTTDDKHNLVVHYDVTNENDRKALHGAAVTAKENIGLNREAKLTALADKGYFNAEQLHACKKEHIITYVPPTYYRSRESIPMKGYHGEDFRYHPKSDTYTCPEGTPSPPTGTGTSKCTTAVRKQKALPGSSTTKPTNASDVR